MKKILHINSSTRGVESVTRQLGIAIIEKIRMTDPKIVVQELDLSNNPFPHLGQDKINSFFTPEEFRTPEQIIAIKQSDDAIEQLKEADILVISAPMYNFSITSSLKAYFDHIARAKVTFEYSSTGSEGLLKNKKAYIAFGSAGVFDNEQMRGFDFAVPYIKHFLGFIGIQDVSVFRVEGTAIPEMQDTAMQNAINSITL